MKQKYPIYLQFRKKIDIKTSTKEFFGYIDAKMSIYTQEDINWWVLLEQNVSIYPKCKMIVQDTSSVSTFCKKILSYRCKNLMIAGDFSGFLLVIIQDISSARVFVEKSQVVHEKIYTYVTVQPAPLAKSYFVLIGNCVAIFAHNLALST